jgi:hypothetical protein
VSVCVRVCARAIAVSVRNKAMLGLGTGRQEMVLFERETNLKHCTNVRVHVSTGYNPGEGNR